MQQQVLEREDAIELHGIIEEALPGTWFRVSCENGHSVLATLSGKLRINHIRLLPGDRVSVEVSPYDLTRGRVTYRRLRTYMRLRRIIGFIGGAFSCAVFICDGLTNSLLAVLMTALTLWMSENPVQLSSATLFGHVVNMR